MMRRRAFFGGKKEPVYLFKEGTGFIANPLPGVTLTKLCDPGTATYGTDKITFEPKLYDLSWENPRFSIYMPYGAYAKRVIDFAASFPGYKKLFIETSADALSGPHYCGLTSDFAPEASAGTWLQKKSFSADRTVSEFDVANVTGYISVASSLMGYSVHKSYIHNVWLE